jgi:cytochrome P450
VAFGSGAHFCLGAAHARLLLRSLIQGCTERVGRIEVQQAVDRVEEESRYRRVVGYESLVVRLVGNGGLVS